MPGDQWCEPVTQLNQITPIAITLKGLCITCQTHQEGRCEHFCI